MTIEPEQKFRTLSEAVVLAALVDPDPENPISREVRRLAAAFTAELRNDLEKLGYVRPQLMHAEPRWPIEAVAYRLAREEVGKDISAA